MSDKAMRKLPDFAELTREGMTYRQIREYVNAEGWNPGGDGLANTLMFGLLPDDPDAMPRGVIRWITHEVLPTLRKTGRYVFPAALDELCPYTLPVEPAQQID